MNNAHEIENRSRQSICLSFHASRSSAYMDPIVARSKRLQYMHVLIIVVCMTCCYITLQTTISDATLNSLSTPMCPLMLGDQSVTEDEESILELEQV